MLNITGEDVLSDKDIYAIKDAGRSIDELIKHIRVDNIIYIERGYLNFHKANILAVKVNDSLLNCELKVIHLVDSLSQDAYEIRLSDIFYITIQEYTRYMTWKLLVDTHSRMMHLLTIE